MSRLQNIWKAVTGQPFSGLPGGLSNWPASWLASGSLAPNRGDNPQPAESIGVSAVYAAVSLLAGSLAGTDLQLIKRLPSGANQRVSSGAVALLLADLPFESIESFLWNALIDGNGYLKKIRDKRGAVAELRWVPAHRVSVAIADDTRVWYVVEGDDSVKESAETIAVSDIVHLRFRTIGRHRYLGVSPLVTCAPSMGLVAHTRSAGVSVYRNVSAPSVVLSHPKKLEPDLIKRVKEAYIQATSGTNVGKPLVLSDGITAAPFNIAQAIDLQLSEMTKLGVTEVARVYQIPQHMLGEQGSVNYSSAAEANRAFVSNTLRPWARRVSGALSHSLLGRDDRLSGHRVEFDLSSLVKGNGTELADYLSKLVNGGIVSANEARQQLNYGDVKNGDVLRAPSNTFALDHWRGWSPVKPEPDTEQQKALIEASIQAFEGNIMRKAAWNQHEEQFPELPEPPNRAELLDEFESCGLTVDQLVADGDLEADAWEALPEVLGEGPDELGEALDAIDQRTRNSWE